MKKIILITTLLITFTSNGMFASEEQKESTSPISHRRTSAFNATLGNILLSEIEAELLHEKILNEERKQHKKKKKRLKKYRFNANHVYNDRTLDRGTTLKKLKAAEKKLPYILDQMIIQANKELERQTSETVDISNIINVDTLPGDMTLEGMEAQIKLLQKQIENSNS